MKINAKHSLRDEVFVCGVSKIIYAISLDANNIIEYRLWDNKTNCYDWYDEWQVKDKEELVWFNSDEDG